MWPEEMGHHTQEPQKKEKKIKNSVKNREHGFDTLQVLVVHSGWSIKSTCRIRIAGAFAAVLSPRMALSFSLSLPLLSPRPLIPNMEHGEQYDLCLAEMSPRGGKPVLGGSPWLRTGPRRV